MTKSFFKIFLKGQWRLEFIKVDGGAKAYEQCKELY